MLFLLVAYIKKLTLRESKSTMRSWFNIIKPFLKEITRLPKPSLLKLDIKFREELQRIIQKSIKRSHQLTIGVGRVIQIRNLFHIINKNKGGFNQKYVKLCLCFLIYVFRVHGNTLNMWYHR